MSNQTSVFKDIPVGFTATVEQIAMWTTLQERRAQDRATHRSPLAFERWVATLTTPEACDLARISLWEAMYGSVNVDRMLTGMREHIAAND